MRLVAGIAALLFTPMVTFGLVDAARHFEAWKLMSIFTYQGFFAYLYGLIWAAWCDLHGFAPFSHLDEFAPFFTRSLFLGIPLIGFGMFWLASGYKIGRDVWKPVAVALIFSTPLEGLIYGVFQAVGLSVAAAEAARAMVVVLFMIASTRLRFSSRKPVDSEPLKGPHLSTN
jgi:hypothetical protein